MLLIYLLLPFLPFKVVDCIHLVTFIAQLVFQSLPNCSHTCGRSSGYSLVGPELNQPEAE